MPIIPPHPDGDHNARIARLRPAAQRRIELLVRAFNADDVDDHAVHDLVRRYLAYSITEDDFDDALVMLLGGEG